MSHREHIREYFALDCLGINLHDYGLELATPCQFAQAAQCPFQARKELQGEGNDDPSLDQIKQRCLDIAHRKFLPMDLRRELGEIVRTHIMEPIEGLALHAPFLICETWLCILTFRKAGPKKMYQQMRYVLQPTNQAIGQAFEQHFTATTSFPIMDEMDPFCSRLNKMRYDSQLLKDLQPKDMHVTGHMFLGMCQRLAPGNTLQPPDMCSTNGPAFDELDQQLNDRAGRMGIMDQSRDTPMHDIGITQGGYPTLRAKKSYDDCDWNEQEQLRQTLHGTVVRINIATLQNITSVHPDILCIIQPYKTLEVRLSVAPSCLPQFVLYATDRLCRTRMASAASP